MKEKELEIAAQFKEGNCNFTILQPIKDSSKEELETFYISLAKAAFKPDN